MKRARRSPSPESSSFYPEHSPVPVRQPLNFLDIFKNFYLFIKAEDVTQSPWKKVVDWGFSLFRGKEEANHTRNIVSGAFEYMDNLWLEMLRC